MEQSGWDFIKVRVIKQYEVGLKVLGRAPHFSGLGEIRNLAEEALALAVRHYGDMLLPADLQVKETSLGEAQGLRIGHATDLLRERDLTKFIQVDIGYDKQTNSYTMTAMVYRHIVDGIPALLLLYLIHNHLVLRRESHLSACARVPQFMLQDQLDRFNVKVDAAKWKEVMPREQDHFLSVGAQVGISGSNIYKLRRKIAADIASYVSASSVELALLAMEMGLNYASDCVARGPINRSGKLLLSEGYEGLGHVHTRGYADICGREAKEQYAWLCSTMKQSTEEMILERLGKGKSSKVLRKVSRIPDSARLFSDKFAPYDCIMSVANSQILGSNLNGIAFGVPICVGDITPADITGFGVPAHPEHGPEVIEARLARGLKQEITEISYVCGERIKNADGVYKALKTSKGMAIRILNRWGHDENQLKTLSISELVKKVFVEAYRPDSPLEGRIEKLAARLLSL